MNPVHIHLDGVWKSFGERTALCPITLEVGGGEVVALVGPNGAGKSTTLRVLAGAIRPSGGTATLQGIDVVRDGVWARRGLGYLPQRLGVPAATVVADLAALVAAMRGVSYRDATAALARAGLGGRLGTTLAELSGGERQRAMLALATLGPIAALVLDEPSISLDSDGAEDAREAIRAARKGGTAVLFASHHLHDVAALADRIVVMVDGCVVAQGTVAELAAIADVPWTEHAVDAPIERIYRVLVGQGRAGQPSRRRLALVREDVA